MKLINSLLLASSLLFSSFISAATITVEDAYVRATPPHTQTSAAFMKLSNKTDKRLKLVAASSDIAERVELHSHTMSDGMMKMRQVEDISIDANQTVELRPGSFHVMFFGLLSPLKKGDNVTLKLYFDNGDELIIEAPVKNISTKKNTEHNH